MACSARRPLVLRSAKLGAKAFAKPRTFSQLLQLAVQKAATCNQGNRRLDPHQPAMLNPGLSDLFPQPFCVGKRFAVGTVTLLPFLDGQLLPLQFLLSILQLGQGLVDPRVLGSRLEQIVEPLLKACCARRSPANPAPAANSSSPSVPLPDRISSPACDNRS